MASGIVVADWEMQMFPIPLSILSYCHGIIPTPLIVTDAHKRDAQWCARDSNRNSTEILDRKGAESGPSCFTLMCDLSSLRRSSIPDTTSTPLAS